MQAEMDFLQDMKAKRPPAMSRRELVGRAKDMIFDHRAGALESDQGGVVCRDCGARWSFEKEYSTPGRCDLFCVRARLVSPGNPDAPCEYHAERRRRARWVHKEAAGHAD